jgi:hypothetical protein
MRGGDYGWGTTDAERTVYRYAPSPAAAGAAQAVVSVSWDWLRGVIKGIPSAHPPIGFVREVPLDAVLSWIDEAERRALAATPSPEVAEQQGEALTKAAQEAIKWLNSWFRHHDGNKIADKLSAALASRAAPQASGDDETKGGV